MFLRFRIYKGKDGGYYLQFDRGQFLAYIDAAVRRHMPTTVRQQIAEAVKAEFQAAKRHVVTDTKAYVGFLAETAIACVIALSVAVYWLTV